MSVQAPARDAQRLFVYNRALPELERHAEIVAIEGRWIVPLAERIEAESPAFTSHTDLFGAMDDLLERERAQPAESAEYLARQATRDQFRVVVAEFAVDGLTEAQNFFPIIARLPIRAQMAVMRVLIDEFGCGNLDQAHSQLYRQLLAELELPQEIDAYLDDLNDETYAFLNVFFWLAQRAPRPEYFLGGLAYLEASIPTAFSYNAEACARLGIANGRYYTEHMHIDEFHMREMRTAIRELSALGPVDHRKVWVGVRLLSDVVGQAVDAAVAKARRLA